MITIVSVFEVKDFNTWKQFFDSGTEKRSKAGVTPRSIYRGIDNPNTVTIIAEVSDVETARSYSATVRPVMEQFIVAAPVVIISEEQN